MRTGYNNLTLAAYERSSMTKVYSADYDYRRASGISFETYYPGGLFGTATARISQDVLFYWQTRGAHRIVLYNDAAPCYEGYVSQNEREYAAEGQNLILSTVGAWGDIANKYNVSAQWSWRDTSKNSWAPQYSEYAEQFNYQVIDGKIHISPVKSEEFIDGQYMATRYDAGSANIRRVKLTTQFYEDSGAWEIGLWRSTNASSWTQITAASGDTYTAGTTTVKTTADAAGTYTDVDVTLGTASRYLEFRFYSKGVNEPIADEHIHGMMWDVSVMTDSGGATARKVINRFISDTANATTDFVSSAPTVALENFGTKPREHEYWADVVTRAVSFGNNDGNQYAVYYRESEFIGSPDGKPIVVCEAQPSTEYKYVVRVDDKNIVPSLTFSEYYGDTLTWVHVLYTDADTGQTAVSSVNTASSYGTRANIVKIGTSTAADALAFANRYIARYGGKPQWVVNSPITVCGFIYGAGGEKIPASLIRAGNRVLIADFDSDPTQADIVTSGLSLLVTRTQYNDDDETCTLSFGETDVY